MESKLSVGSAEQPLEAFDQLCDICKDDSMNKAIGHCQQCNQYLCQQCCDHHSRIVGTKHHKVIGKDETKVFGRETLFGRKLIPLSVIVIPPLPSVDSSSIPQIKYVNFFRDVDKMVVPCWYPYNKTYAVFEIKDGKQERHSIVIANDIAICLDMKNDTTFVIIRKNNVVSELDLSLPLFSEKELFKTEGECRALVEFDHGFAAAIKMSTNYTLPEWQIHYMGRDGKIETHISYDAGGLVMLDCPIALASNHTKNSLFVLDSGKQILLGLNIAGEIMFKFTHSDMGSPRSLDVDREGNIYVACQANVLQVNMDGTKHVVVMQNKTQETTLVAYNSAKDILVLGNGTEKLQCFMFV